MYFNLSPVYRVMIIIYIIVKAKIKLKCILKSFLVCFNIAETGNKIFDP